MKSINIDGIEKIYQYIPMVEKEFKNFIGQKYAIAVSSGTSGIEVALRALNVGSGDEVILPVYDWGASLGAVIRCGARPILCDIDAGTGVISLSSLKKLVNDRTKVVIVTHLSGFPARIHTITTFLRKVSLQQNKHIYVIEDCCQALGTRIKNHHAGMWGDFSIFSFGRGKILDVGEGGMLLTPSEELWKRAVSVSQHPIRQRILIEPQYQQGDLAMNARMHPVAAFLLHQKLPILEEKIKAKRYALSYLANRLKKALGPSITCPADPPWGVHGAHQLSIYLSRKIAEFKDAIIEKLQAHGWYAFPRLYQPLYERRQLKGMFPPHKFPGLNEYLKHIIYVDFNLKAGTKVLDNFVHNLVTIVNEIRSLL